jgi:prophage antirepressor-like protein
VSALRVFDFDGASVRLVSGPDGEPWFVANDVARLLGYAVPKDAVAAHCRGAAKHRLPTDGGEQDVAIIPERDVYRLVMRSRLPAAERFEAWVVGEVLPSIRKTGNYAAPQTLEQIALAAITGLQARVAEQSKQLAIAAPKAEAFDRYVDAPGCMCLREAAQHLGRGEREFVSELVERRYLYRQPTMRGRSVLRAYAGYVESGLFTVRFVPGVEFPQVLVTRAGLAVFGQASLALTP